MVIDNSKAISSATAMAFPGIILTGDRGGIGLLPVRIIWVTS